jgi:hypothetical protein
MGPGGSVRRNLRGSRLLVKTFGVSSAIVTRVYGDTLPLQNV